MALDSNWQGEEHLSSEYIYIYTIRASGFSQRFRFDGVSNNEVAPSLSHGVASAARC